MEEILNDILQHHGTKGMRWGVRKYQHPDGSLTEAGKKRYSDDSSTENKKKKPLTEEQMKARNKKIVKGVLIGASVTAAAAATAYYIKNKDKINAKVKTIFSKKGIHKTDTTVIRGMERDVARRRLLTDEDLKQKVERLKMQKSLKDLTNEQLYPGRTAIGKILGDSGKKVGGIVITGASLYGIKAAISKKANRQEAAQYIAPKPKNK